MANPNIVNVTNIYGKTAGAALTTVSADVVVNAAASGKVFKVNSIYAANVDGVNNADVTIAVYDASAAASYRLAYTITVPADAALDVLSNSIYLEEGDKITALASAANRIEILVSYEEIY